MALNINGSTGISGIDGSNSAPALTGTDSNTGINFGTDSVQINTAGTNRVKIDANGRIGILNPNLNNFDASADDLVINGTGNTGITINSGAASSTSEGNLVFAEGNGSGGSADGFRGAIQYKHGDDHMTFYCNNAAKLRLDAQGRVGIGTTTTNNPDVGDGGLQIRTNQTEGAPDVHFTRSSRSGISNVVGFVNGNVGVGSIAYSNSGTSFNTSSDYRLKENVVSISDGITRVKALKPYKFNFIGDSKIVDGFLAHEVTPVVPEAITGEKDGMKPETYYQEGDTLPSGKVVGDVKTYSSTNPEYQGIDQGKLVPLLTAALQEAVAKIEVLETKVAALEAG